MWAVRVSHENYDIPGAEAFGFVEGEDIDRAEGQAGDVPGGVLIHGTYEWDDSVTWETLISPREVRHSGGR